MIEESKSKYKRYAKILLGVLALPFMLLIWVMGVLLIGLITNKIWELRGQPSPDCGYKLKDVKRSGYTMDGFNYKRYPNCGCIMAMEKEE
ncbi:MAG: hypothetical protein WA977_00550 [Halobacteriota archaeon]